MNISSEVQKEGNTEAVFPPEFFLYVAFWKKGLNQTDKTKIIVFPDCLI